MSSGGETAGSIPGATVERLSYPVIGVGEVLSSAETEDDGTFRLEGVNGARVHLCVRADGYARRAQTIEIPADADAEGVILVAEPSSAIEVLVVDERGSPVEGTRASLRDEGGQISYPEHNPSRADGALRFPDATAGEWYLTVLLPDPHDGWERPQLYRKVSGGERVRVEARRGVPGVAELDVAVVDAGTGEALAPTGAQVWCDTVDDSGITHRQQAKAERSVGRIRARGLRPGSWKLRVDCRGYGMEIVPFDVTTSDLRIERRVAMEPAATLRGRVVGAEDVSDLLVHADRHAVAIDAEGRPSPGTLSRTSTVATDGSFRFGELDPGPLTLRVRSSRYVGEVIVEVTSRTEASVEIEVEAAGTVVFAGAERYDLLLVTSTGHDAESRADHVGARASVTLPAGSRSIKVRDASQGRGGPVIWTGSIDVKAGEETTVSLP